jgi:hypothetical protein
VILDGTPIERSAAMRAPHDDAADSRGALNFTPQRRRNRSPDPFEAAGRVLVQQAGNQRLVRETLRERTLLDRLQVISFILYFLRVYPGALNVRRTAS